MFILYTNFSKPLAPFTSRTIAYISSFHWRLSIANCYCDTGFFLVETYLSKYCQKPVELFNACVLFTLIYSVCKQILPSVGFCIWVKLSFLGTHTVEHLGNGRNQWGIRSIFEVSGYSASPADSEENRSFPSWPFQGFYPIAFVYCEVVIYNLKRNPWKFWEFEGENVFFLILIY